MQRNDGSWETFEDYVLDYALDCASNGLRYVLVTLVGIVGSSPRFLGAQMAVAENGFYVGYLSGGCIERAIVSEALDALLEGRNRLVRYGEGSRYFDIQLPCGSGIDLLFDVSQPTAEIYEVNSRVAKRLAAELVLSLPVDQQDVSKRFTVPYQPRRRLVIAGGGPASVQLAQLAKSSGFEVIVYSADQATRDHATSAGARVLALTSPGKRYEIPGDSKTAIVFMFHDHLWEDSLLPAALETSAYYIGAMGSKATHRKRREKLVALGVTVEQIDRIHGPAGVFGGSKSAQNIAISILADVVRDEHGSFRLPHADDQSRLKTAIVGADDEIRVFHA